MPHYTFPLLACALGLLSHLRPQATSGSFHLIVGNEVLTKNGREVLNSSSDGGLDYTDNDVELAPALNETLYAEWRISVRNGTLVLHHEITPKGIVAEQSFESEDIYYVEDGNSSPNSSKDLSTFSNATDGLVLGNVSSASIPDLLLVLDAQRPCKGPSDQLSGTSCTDTQGRRKLPFRRFYPFLRPCPRRRRPRRRCRRRRRKTTPRPSAMLANFTFINQVNNQGYLTLSNTSNLNSSSRE